jgi:hypothetical protein
LRFFVATKLFFFKKTIIVVKTLPLGSRVRVNHDLFFCVVDISHQASQKRSIELAMVSVVVVVVQNFLLASQHSKSFFKKHLTSTSRAL